MQNSIIDPRITATHRRRAKRRGNDTIGSHRLPTCTTSGKVRYRDHDQARDGLVSAKEARLRSERVGQESRRREARSYRCTDCRGWHTSSIATWVESSHGVPTSAA